MKHISTLLLATLLYAGIFAQQDVKLSGLVVEQNSKFNTGEVVFLSKAQVKSYGAAPQLSDINGTFTLVFADKPVGNVTRVYTSKNGYEVVNDEVLKRAAVLGRNRPLKVVMCKEGQLYENQMAYYKIVQDVYKETYDQRIAILEKEGREKEQLFAELEIEFNQQITSVKQANELLLNQLYNAQKEAKELTEKWAIINLDDQTEEYQEAFRKFLSKDVDGALEILNKIDLEKRLTINTIEKKKEEESIAKREKQIKQDIEQCLFKAQLHTLKYEFDKVEEMYELALKHDSENPDILFVYALYLQNQNQHNQAQPLYDKALIKYRKLAQDNPQTYFYDVAATLSSLGLLLGFKSEFEKAEQSHYEALNIYIKLLKINPKVYLPDIASILNNLGPLYRKKNEIERAKQSYELALKIYKKVVKTNPHTYIHSMVGTLNNLAVLHREKNEFEQAENLFRKILEIYIKLDCVNPKVYLPKVANILNNLAVLQCDKNEFKQAEQSFQDALKIRQLLAEGNPQAYLPDVAISLNNLGNLKRDTNEFNEAEQFYLQSLKIKQHLAEVNPQTYLPDLALSLSNFGVLQGDQNEFEKAEKSYSEALVIFRKIAEINPQNYLQSVAMTLNNLGLLQNKKNELKKAGQSFTEALELYRQLAEVNPKMYLPYVGTVLNNLAVLRCIKNEFVHAEQTYLEALKIRRKLVKTNPQVYIPDLAATQIGMSMFYQENMVNKNLSIQMVDEAITNLLPFEDIPIFRNFILIALDILNKWNVDIIAYLKEKEVKIKE